MRILRESQTIVEDQDGDERLIQRKTKRRSGDKHGYVQEAVKDFKTGKMPGKMDFDQI